MKVHKYMMKNARQIAEKRNSARPSEGFRAYRSAIEGLLSDAYVEKDIDDVITYNLKTRRRSRLGIAGALASGVGLVNSIIGGMNELLGKYVFDSQLLETNGKHLALAGSIMVGLGMSSILTHFGMEELRKRYHGIPNFDELQRLARVRKKASEDGSLTLGTSLDDLSYLASKDGLGGVIEGNITKLTQVQNGKAPVTQITLSSENEREDAPAMTVPFLGSVNEDAIGQIATLHTRRHFLYDEFKQTLNYGNTRIKASRFVG